MRQFLFVTLIATCGFAVLMSLGFWQLRRLEWKEALIAEADRMMELAPVPLPIAPDPKTDRYRPVFVSGRFTGQEVYVLTSTREWGPGYRVIAGFETDEGRQIMVDRGYLPETWRDVTRPARAARVSGNLNWPDDVTSGTPAPDIEAKLWFGRDALAMAEYFGSEPVMVIARENTGDDIAALPATAAFKNDHLGYAVTWFGLATVWAGMTLGYLWRIRRRTV